MAVIKGVRLKELQARVDAANRTMVLIAAQTYVELVKRMMRDGAKSGAPGPVRQRSAPGEAPAVQYGKLIADIAVDAKHVMGQGWVATAGLRGNAPYGIGLEFGTDKIAPRPAWRPAFTPALELARAAIEKQFPRDTGASLTGTATIAPSAPAQAVAA